jgi:ATP-binding cassette subfamily B protein
LARRENIRESLPLLARFYRRFWPQLRTQQRLIGGSLFVLIAEVFLRLLEPWPLSFVIDWVIAPPSSGKGWKSVETLTDGVSPTLLISLAAAALVATASLRALSRYMSAVGFALIGNRLLTEVRNQLYRHLQRLSLAFHGKARSGDLTMRVINDVGMVREVVVTALLPLAGNLLVLAGMLAMMVWMNWKLALAAFATIPLFWLSTVRLGKQIREVSKKQRRSEGDMASTAAESLSAIQTVQALSLDETFSESFEGGGQRSLKEGVKGKRLSAQLERTTDVLSALSQALVLWFGAHLVLRGELTAGQLLVYISYLRAAFRPIRNFAKYSARIAKASAAGERVLEVLEQEPDVVEKPNAVSIPPMQRQLCFEDVTFEYAAGQPVIENLSFDLSSGTRLALVGPSGAGKSTIIGLVLRLQDPTGGRILLDGHDLRDLTLSSLRSQMSVVLQDTLLFTGTIAENIAYGSPNATQKDIAAAVASVGADSLIRDLPDGYASVVGEKGVTLSRGQRQRVAAARAAIRQAPVLLLDEPTSGLDHANKRILAEALESLSRDRTVILVTHELEHAVDYDEILFIESGRVSERGTHDELLSKNARYAALYRLQAEASQPTAKPDASSGG